jgi:hypothetical protein
MSNFAFLAAELPAVHEAALEAEHQAVIGLPYGNISGTI